MRFIRQSSDVSKLPQAPDIPFEVHPALIHAEVDRWRLHRCARHVCHEVTGFGARLFWSAWRLRELKRAEPIEAEGEGS